MRIPGSIIFIHLLLMVRSICCQSLYSPGQYGPSVGSACACSFDYRPVCGSNGKTYSSPCGLRCEQLYNPTIIQLFDGPCRGFLFNSPPTSVVSPLIGGTAGFGGGFPINPTNLNCVWQCPATAVSYGNTPYNSPLGVYGINPTSLPVPLTVSHVCDNRGNFYQNDCQFFRAVCEWEKRGLPVVRSTCPLVRGEFGALERSLKQRDTTGTSADDHKMPPLNHEERTAHDERGSISERLQPH